MRSDKMQMSMVPQTSEHVLISDGTAATRNVVKDIVLPHGAIVADIRVIMTVKEATASGAQIIIGTTADTDYYKTAINCASGGTVGVQSSIIAATMMTPVAADRIVRITPTSFSASSIARVYVYVIYRFAPNAYPTQLTA